MITLGGIELPSELVWVDEFQFSRVTSRLRVTLQGKAVIESSSLNTDTGRPVTLSGDDAWVDRDTLLTLRSMADVPGTVMKLVLHDNRTYQVQFRAWEGSVVDGIPIVNTAYPSSETLYRLTLKLMVS